MKIENDTNQVKNNDYKNNDIVCSTDILNDKINNKDILNCSTYIIDSSNDQEDIQQAEKVSCHLQPSVASLHQISSSSDVVYFDMCEEKSATPPLPPCRAEEQSEGQGEKGKRGAYVPPSLRESPTGAVLSGACDVTKGLPQVHSATIPVLSGACDVIKGVPPW